MEKQPDGWNEAYPLSAEPWEGAGDDEAPLGLGPQFAGQIETNVVHARGDRSTAARRPYRGPVPRHFGWRVGEDPLHPSEYLDRRPEPIGNEKDYREKA